MSAHFFGSPGTFSKQKVRSVNKFFIPKFSYQYLYQYFHTNISFQKFMSYIHHLSIQECVGSFFWVTWYILKAESSLCEQIFHTKILIPILIPIFSYQHFISKIHELHPSSFYTRMCRLTFLGHLVHFQSRKFAL